MKHAHPEAFMLMTYASDDGSEREVLWNSRDGVTPFSITSPNGAEMFHIEWKRDRYAPEHTPKVGDRIFVDLTPQRAQVFAARRVEQMLAAEYRSQLEEQYSSREEAVAAIAKEMLEGDDWPDILVVTAGYIEELKERRGAQQGIAAGGASLLPTAPGTIAPEGGKKALVLDEAEPALWFDRQGRPIDEREFERLHRDDSYKILAQTQLSGHWVSTVWLGCDYGFGFDAGAPIIFETMMFRGMVGETRGGQLQDRYRTETEALKGHELVCERWRDQLAGKQN